MPAIMAAITASTRRTETYRIGLCRGTDGQPAEYLGKRRAQRDIDLRHRSGNPEAGERGDAVTGGGRVDAAGYDAAVMVEVGIDVQREAVIGHPAAHSHPDRGDLVLAPALVRQAPGNPDADPSGAPLALDVEARQRRDDPLLKAPDMAAYVAAPFLQIEHDIGDALPRSVIGVLTAAAGAMHRQARRVEQILRPRAGPGGVERRVLQKPHQLSRCAIADRRDP